VYIDGASHVKMKKDLVEFMGGSMR